MTPRYSQMSPEELQKELEVLRDAGQRAFDERKWNEYEILMQKWYLAKSYLIRDEVQIETGRTYRLAEEHDRLTVEKIEGVMAWGIRESTGRPGAVPIAMLVSEDE